MSHPNPLRDAVLTYLKRNPEMTRAQVAAHFQIEPRQVTNWQRDTSRAGRGGRVAPDFIEKLSPKEPPKTDSQLSPRQYNLKLALCRRLVVLSPCLKYMGAGATVEWDVAYHLMATGSNPEWAQANEILDSI